MAITPKEKYNDMSLFESWEQKIDKFILDWKGGKQIQMELSLQDYEEIQFITDQIREVYTNVGWKVQIIDECCPWTQTNWKGLTFERNR